MHDSFELVNRLRALSVGVVPPQEARLCAAAVLLSAANRRAGALQLTPGSPQGLGLVALAHGREAPEASVVAAAAVQYDFYKAKVCSSERVPFSVGPGLCAYRVFLSHAVAPPVNKTHLSPRLARRRRRAHQAATVQAPGCMPSACTTRGLRRGRTRN